MNYIYQLVISVVAGGLGAWIAMLFALKRFYSEKWWEKRAGALIELTNAIYQVKVLQDYYSDLKEYQRLGPDEYPNFIKLSAEKLSKLQISAAEAKDLIVKYSNIGPLLVTESVSKLLTDYLKREDKVDYEVNFQGLDTDDAEEHLLSLTNKLLEDLVKESKSVLKAK
ncbi:hypothetical protein ACTM9O_13135 [Citrobacter freundii]|uniref:hypothetical protein n=1 Tax=Citrobacter TaxID=544 RepID=UPI00206A148B|nr:MULTISPECIES: hypothetical protein [Citrobacter]EKV4110586.1 hypothetical protein [Citrobacter freundii]MDM3055198.1 hypothetical protein [Citrobacter sp. Cf236]DAZ18053.1 MAG TPA: hypothetical protein [Caudoviricetes sp.]